MRANDRPVDKFCGPIPDSPSLIGMLRPALALGSLVVTAALLTACASEPEPEWTEEEAYAAAEETFREFNDAVYDDGASTLEFVTGEMTALEREGEERAKEDRLAIRGEAVVTRFEPESVDLLSSSAAVTASACIDSSNIEVRTGDDDWTSARDDAVYGVIVSFASADGRMLITEYADSEQIQC